MSGKYIGKHRNPNLRLEYIDILSTGTWGLMMR
jgi:hypothetical protein